MRRKVLHMLLVLSSLCGYLHWGGGNSMFLFEAEWEILAKLFTAPKEVIHPFVLIPLAGQVLLLAGLFQKQPSSWLTWLGMGSLALLLLLMFLIGVLDFDVRILLSTIPFVIVCVVTILHLRKSVREI